ncbi:MAG TPA: TMEM175 family protein [Candidatus Paceibacterota bacterium]|jgi:uncharacterized membrane protein|nr:TMEM175 family protein [Candidatus Paceibacterota bacterium]
MQITHNKTRLEQFSDGVFAIAITLLAFELKIPHLSSSTLAGGLRELLPLVPNIATFILSFVTIAIFWVNHHQLTQDIGPIRRRLAWANVLTLFFVTLIPFGTEVASANPFHPLAIMTYAVVLFGGSVSFTILRYFVHRSCGETKVPMRRSLVGPIIYLLATVVAMVSVRSSYFLLAIPPIFYFLPKGRQRADDL